ncbi:Transforming growth factor beta-1 [Oopsacas minuta]|uniref:Transforming growth factor beta-1 n=1 Tax=Oopsacas minuta TaxID=111878 RepID=A0AAV7KBH8_9METZ|nr:Transforming growth factor beta-1 [Oopsacas minuta]
MKLLYKAILFSLLLHDVLYAIVTTENVNCDDSSTANGSDNNLCVRNKVLEKYSRIESLKKEILAKLDLSEAPNVTAPRELSVSMLEDFSSLQVASSTTHTAPYYAMPITTHTVTQTRHKFGITQKDSQQSAIYAHSYLMFNLTILSKNKNIYKSKLRLRLGKELSLFPELPTNVHKLVLCISQEGNEMLVLKKTIAFRADTYTLDITKYLQNLVKKELKSRSGDISLSFNIRIAVLKNGKKITRLVDEGKSKARIIIQSYDERDAEARRSRRAVSSRYCLGRNEKKCCVRPLEINFKEDLGWDYIQTPTSFNANYCAGTCPLNWHTENNLFYDILYKYATNNNKHIGPCCVPNEYGSLNVVYFDAQNEPVTAKIPDVIVRSCSCR